MLALLLLPLLASQVASTCWQHNQRNHAFSPPSPRQMSYLDGCMAKETSFQPLLEPLLQPRVPGSAGHTAARQHIEAKMRELGWSVELDTFTASTPLGSRTFSNIVATLHPDSPRRLVLAAHYDSKVTPAGFVGAIDSAVPCAMLLHLAVSMTSLLRGAVGSVPELSLQLVFFDGEEAFVSWSATDSLYGSRHLASAWATTPYTVRSGKGHCQEGSATQLDRIDSLVLLDLLGAARPTFHRYLQFNTSLYDLASQLEESLGRRACLQGTSMFSGTNKYSMIQDDHLPFFNLGVRQILHMIADPFPFVWHTLQDDRDALDTITIMQINKLLRTLVFSYLG